MSCCGQKRDELRRPPVAATTAHGASSRLTAQLRAFLARKAIAGPGTADSTRLSRTGAQEQAE
jgi:hypothetical protein